MTGLRRKRLTSERILREDWLIHYQLSKHYTGETKLTICYAEKMEKAFGIGVDWLLFGAKEAKIYPCGDEMILFLKRNPEIQKMISKVELG